MASTDTIQSVFLLFPSLPLSCFSLFFFPFVCVTVLVIVAVVVAIVALAVIVVVLIVVVDVGSVAVACFPMDHSTGFRGSSTTPTTTMTPTTMTPSTPPPPPPPPMLPLLNRPSHSFLLLIPLFTGLLSKVTTHFSLSLHSFHLNSSPNHSSSPRSAVPSPPCNSFEKAYHQLIINYHAQLSHAISHNRDWSWIDSANETVIESRQKSELANWISKRC